MQNTSDYILPTDDSKVVGIWEKYFPYWPLFLIMACLSISIAYIYVRYRIPLYESSATLLIKDEKRGMEDTKTMESLNPISTKKTIENEIEILKSRALMLDVAKRLYLYAPVYEKGRVQNMSAYATCPVKIELREPEKLIEVEDIRLTVDKAAGTVIADNKTFKAGEWSPSPWGDIKFSLAGTSHGGSREMFFQLINLKKLTKGLQANLDVSSGKVSSVINLKMKDQVPDRAEDILNTLVASYNRAAVADKNTLTHSTLAFLDERLAIVSGQLDSIEQKLQQYRSAKGAIDISSQGKLFLQNVSDNDQKLNDVNMKMAALAKVKEYVLAPENQMNIAPSTVGLDDALLANLVTRLYDAELQYEKLKRTTGENSPQLTSITDQIEKIKPSILTTISNQQKSLESAKQTLNITNTQYNSVLQTLPKQEKDLVEISREQNIKSSIYSFLLQKREETALSQSSTLSDTRIVDAAEASLEPVGLPSSVIFIIALILAFGISILIVTVRDLFSSTIVSRQEIEAMSSYPVLAEIGFDKSKNFTVLNEQNAKFSNEDFRLLRTSLSYLGLSGGHRKILITSTVAGEGKSYVTINLAKSLALSGKKVVVVESDLINPTISSKLDLPQHLGLSDYLSDAATIDQIIHQTQWNQNFFIIPAGTLEGSDSELILKSKTPSLLQKLEEQFDYILIDTSPVGLVSDGYVLSKYCDATLYVVRPKRTPKKLFRQLEYKNRINELKNLAIVFNGVKERGLGGANYGYGYGYQNSDQSGARKNKKWLHEKNSN